MIEGEPGREGTGIMLAGLPRAIKILATHEATDEQRRVASERARTVQQLRADGGETDERFIAVDTAPDEHNRGAVSVMIWDTQAEEIVGNNVYDVQARPRLGEVAMWDTHSAEYVGTGQAL